MPEDKERIEDILESAARLPQSQRMRHILDASDGDSKIVAEVLSLLEAETEESLKEFLAHDLPRILTSAAFSHGRSAFVFEEEQLQREEAEEKGRFEGKRVGKDDRYEVIGLLRFGPMASLFYAKDTNVNDVDVIIKIPRITAYIKSDDDSQQVEQEKANVRNYFRTEFDSLAMLRGCPNVVQILELGVLSDGRPFMVQEFIDGQNALERLVTSSGLSLVEVAHIIRQAGRGLNAAHACEIHHCDVKAENIMIGPDESVKLIDFNAAITKLAISPRSTVFIDQTWGTLGYASPEQLTNMMEIDQTREPKELTPASDIYSLAVTAYQLLTGNMPFSSTNARELIIEQHNCSFVPASSARSGVPREIDDLLVQALNPDPKKRPQDAKQFAEEFASILGKIGSNEIDPPTPDPPLPFSPIPVPRLNRNIVWILVVALLLLGGGFSVWLLKNRTTSAGLISAKTPQASPSASIDTNHSNPRPFAYWLDLRRADGTRMRASGQEPFVYGDTFVMNFRSPQTGFMYLVNEGRNYEDAITFYYEGKFPVRANEKVASERIGFDNKDGIERFWILFSKSPVTLLDEYGSPREIPVERTEQVRGLLNQYAVAGSSAKEDIASAQTNVEAFGDTIAYRLDLRHRKRE
ncbi:MAG TPA: serine/threonine-protein kinase [Pyrinomonadaceae bacterium]|nr:serine/threonine-protein kinase [Pyrinomonadaceae bacterium]